MLIGLFCENRVLLSALHFVALGRAFLRYRNPLRRQSGRFQVAFYDKIWRESAARLGAKFTPLGGGISEIRLGSCRVRVFENTCPIDDPVTLAIAGDKVLTYRMLEEEGLATPRHAGFSFKTMAAALRFLEGSARDCVVKPARGTGGGRGVTTGVRNRSHLARAAAAASVYGDDLLIEEQMEGDNYRLLYLDGKLLDAFVRKAPAVVADGHSNVRKLVNLANAERLKQGAGISQVLITIDFDMKRTLAKAGLSLRSVPPAGTEVTLKTVVNENRGADNTTATDRLCPRIVDAGARAAAAVGVRLAGVDLITTDPSVPLEQSGGAILEVNTPPNYYYHYQKRDGAFPVALYVLKHLLGSSLETSTTKEDEKSRVQEAYRQ